MRAINITGNKFGKLTVISEVPKNERTGSRQNRPKWKCLCDCGN